jgi:hypothetical protein
MLSGCEGFGQAQSLALPLVLGARTDCHGNCWHHWLFYSAYRIGRIAQRYNSCAGPARAARRLRAPLFSRQECAYVVREGTHPTTSFAGSGFSLVPLLSYFTWPQSSYDTVSCLRMNVAYLPGNAARAAYAEDAGKATCAAGAPRVWRRRDSSVWVRVAASLPGACLPSDQQRHAGCCGPGWRAVCLADLRPSHAGRRPTS